MIYIGPWQYERYEWKRKVLRSTTRIFYPYNYSIMPIGDRFAVIGFLFPIGVYFNTIEQAKAATDLALEERGCISMDEERFAKLEILL